MALGELGSSRKPPALGGLERPQHRGNCALSHSSLARRWLLNLDQPVASWVRKWGKGVLMFKNRVNSAREFLGATTVFKYHPN